MIQVNRLKNTNCFIYSKYREENFIHIFIYCAHFNNNTATLHETYKCQQNLRKPSVFFLTSWSLFFFHLTYFLSSNLSLQMLTAVSEELEECDTYRLGFQKEGRAEVHEALINKILDSAAI